MLTVDSKLPLHGICAHLLPTKFLGIIIHIFEIILICDKRQLKTRYETTDLEFAISSNRTSELPVQIFLISNTRAKSLLP